MLCRPRERGSAETFLTCVSLSIFLSEAFCSFLAWHRHFLHCIDRDNSARRGILGDILTTQTKTKLRIQTLQKPKKGVVLLPQRLPEPLQAVTSLLQAVIKHFRFVTELLKCCYHQAVAKTFYNTNINICNATTLDSLKPQQH